MPRSISSIFCAAIVLVIAHNEAGAQTGRIERGRQFARANCERCHSIDRVTQSNLSLAPVFRNLGQRYPIESLREALAEGVVTPHQNMPQFRLAPDQIDDFLAFLDSIQMAR